MSLFRSFLSGLSLGAALLGSAFAATNPHVLVQPQARIVNKIDNAAVTLIPHTTPEVLAHAADKGRLATGTRFNHMMLVLKSSDEQEYALHSLLDQQQDKTSPNYHQWMTPETFGASFGVASTDLAKVTAWLQDEGFSVETVAKGARIIQFSGTSGQVENAFHTEMHSYLLDGETQVANATDISIPAALTNVVAGVARLNTFSPKPNLVNPRKVVLGNDGKMYPAIPGTASPDYTSATSGSHYVGAGDLSTLFNTKPLLAAGINGSGVKIGIIGQTDILLSDVQIYRTMFNLPKNDPIFVQIGGDPGTIADDGESDLDVELSGGIAPMAQINFYTSGNSYFGGGIDAAGVYIVENNSADIISLSYGQCEASLGASGNAFYQVLWEQAASQGQSVFVSSGDSGPSTCNSSSAAYSTTGYGVNGLASTPFNVAVGGTMFSEGVTAPLTGVTQYWGAPAGAPYSTALSYIPEIPWNEGKFDIYPGGYGGIVSGGSGVSLYYGVPSFQSGPGIGATDPTPNTGSVTGFVVPGPHRLLPDVSLEAAGGHDGTIFCSEGSCKLNSDGTVAGIGVVGGTSVAAPSMAGIQALINQKNGGRQGNANYYYYRVAATQSATNCIAANYVTTADATCGFHDINTGNLNIPSNAAGTTSVGWNAGNGYDPAVGLGSADASNLATRWSSVTFNATTTTFTLTPTTGAHGQTENVTISVKPTSGTGVPTGDVSIIAAATYGGLGYYTLSGGAASGTLAGLPAGTYNVYAHYAGDTTYGGSNSAPVSVTISPESSVLTVTPYLLATSGALSATTTYTYGSNVYFDASVAGTSKTGTPSGNVQFTLTTGGTTITPPGSVLDSFADAYFDSGLGLAAYDIMPTYPVLPVGTYTVNAAYSGDGTFNAVKAAPFTITIGPASTTLTLRAVSAEVASGGTATLNAAVTTIAAAAGGLPATGTVTFTDTTTNTVLGTGTLTSGAVVFTTNALTTAGAHTITATYNGDANYSAKTSTAVTITVGGSASTISVAASSLAPQVAASVTLTATVPAGATGTVSFFNNGVLQGAPVTVSTATSTAALAVTTFTAGSHSITATYSGNSTYSAMTSTPIVINVTQNTPTVQLSSQLTSTFASTVAMNAVLIPAPAGTKPNSPAPTGLIQFLDGTTVMGTATAAYLPGGYQNYVAAFTTPSLTVGTHTLTAKYVGDANFAVAVSNIQTVVISKAATTTTLATSATNLGTGTPLTLTANVAPVTPNTLAAVTGSVTFYNGSSVLGTATITGGVATLSTATITTVGTNTITAVYSGDANYLTSTSTNKVTIVTVTPGFTISVNPASLTVKRGTPGTVTVTATSFGNYNGAIALSCQNLPIDTSCSFVNGGSGTPGIAFGGALTNIQTVAVTFSTLAPTGAGLLWLPAMFLAGLLGLTRKRLSVRGRQLIALALIACGMMAASGCGSSSTTATPTGTSTVTILANGAGAGSSPSLQPTATVSLTVQ